MKWFGLGLVFVFAFFVALIVNLPARLVVERAGLADRGVGYDRVSGTIWSGEINGLNLVGQPLGQARFSLKPGALLGGKLRYALNVQGPMGQAEGETGLGLDRSLSVSIDFARINLQQVLLLDSELRRAPSRLALRDVTLDLDSDTRCRAGSGQMTSDVLAVFGEPWNWDGPDMVGTVSCRQGELLIDFRPRNSTEQIEAGMAWDGAAGIYEITARVGNVNQFVRQALRNKDFVPDGNDLVYTRTNALAEQGGLR